jgi:hypothetical protein
MNPTREPNLHRLLKQNLSQNRLLVENYHARESGHPERSEKLDSRLRGNDDKKSDKEIWEF